MIYVTEADNKRTCNNATLNTKRLDPCWQQLPLSQFKTQF